MSQNYLLEIRMTKVKQRKREWRIYSKWIWQNLLLWIQQSPELYFSWEFFCSKKIFGSKLPYLETQVRRVYISGWRSVGEICFKGTRNWWRLSKMNQWKNTSKISKKFSQIFFEPYSHYFYSHHLINIIILENVAMKKMNFRACFLKMNLTKSASVNPRIPRIIFSKVLF